ncbi:hypothetical protein [Mycolicibacterium mageritense]|uniref:Uncharacterized protein n=1 Tax=Mycolicibacterium mageritense TaxID=53462 RepID=A0AAI8TRK1_MYCME|nr:hypothetical protein [Mycolicibacterium mageritense]BDY27541.1 hypothetical protein hbim_01465 [Mycolicibacterium mageritense]
MKPEEFAQFVVDTNAEVARLKSLVAMLRKESAGYRIRLRAAEAELARRQ